MAGAARTHATAARGARVPAARPATRRARRGAGGRSAARRGARVRPRAQRGHGGPAARRPRGRDRPRPDLVLRPGHQPGRCSAPCAARAFPTPSPTCSPGCARPPCRRACSRDAARRQPRTAVRPASRTRRGASRPGRTDLALPREHRRPPTRLATRGYAGAAGAPTRGTPTTSRSAATRRSRVGPTRSSGASGASSATRDTCSTAAKTRVRGRGHATGRHRRGGQPGHEHGALQYDRLRAVLHNAATTGSRRRTGPGTRTSPPSCGAHRLGRAAPPRARGPAARRVRARPPVTGTAPPARHRAS